MAEQTMNAVIRFAVKRAVTSREAAAAETHGISAMRPETAADLLVIQAWGGRKVQINGVLRILDNNHQSAQIDHILAQAREKYTEARVRLAKASRRLAWIRLEPLAASCEERYLTVLQAGAYLEGLEILKTSPDTGVFKQAGNIADLDQWLQTPGQLLFGEWTPLPSQLQEVVETVQEWRVREGFVDQNFKRPVKLSALSKTVQEAEEQRIRREMEVASMEYEHGLPYGSLAVLQTEPGPPEICDSFQTLTKRPAPATDCTRGENSGVQDDASRPQPSRKRVRTAPSEGLRRSVRHKAGAVESQGHTDSEADTTSHASDTASNELSHPTSTATSKSTSPGQDQDSSVLSPRS